MGKTPIRQSDIILTLEWKRSQKGHISTLKLSRDIYKLECETDSDAGYYAGAVEIILTYHG